MFKLLTSFKTISSYFFLILILTGCYNERFAIKPNGKNSKLFSSEDYSSVEAQDQVSFIGAGIVSGIQGGDSDRGKLPVAGLGAKVQFGSFANSVFDAQTMLPGNFMDFIGESDNVTNINLPNLSAHFMWSYPFFIKEKSGKANIQVWNTQNYIGAVYDPSIKFLTILSSDFGVGYSYFKKLSKYL